MDTKSKRILIYRVIPWVAFIILIIFIKKITDPVKITNSWISDQSFKGYVARKYIDQPETKKVEIIVTYQGDNIDSYIIPKDSIFDCLNIDDYIIKEKGSDQYRVIRGSDTIVFKTFLK